MRNLIMLTAFAIASNNALPAQDITGDWHGTLSAGGAHLRLALHFTKNGDGAYTGTMDSLDQGAKGLPLSGITLKDSKLSFNLAPANASYEGVISQDASSITGNWTQGQSFPLAFKRAATSSAQAEPRRPQNPVKPYPYSEEDVTYLNPAAGIHLAATFTTPHGKGPFPAVLLITGSGPQDRDETLMGHKPFLVLSDFLTRHGIAVLRADDRGIGKSEGTFASATTADFATDAEAGLAYLKTRPEADPHKLGLIGHSEGAIIAPMVAARNHDVAFIVMLAGTGVPGDQILLEQSKRMMQAAGMKPDAVENALSMNRESFALIRTETDEATLNNKLRDLLSHQLPAAQLDQQMKTLDSPWLRFFIRYDPAPALRKVTCPVLALNGAKDWQVPPQQNLPAIRKALEQSGNQHFEADELPGLNHLFQTALTGAPGEYAQIEETMSSAALQKIVAWLTSLS